jgi:capsular exopolysaccharide synthesis family protein
VLADIPIRGGAADSIAVFAESFRLLRTNLRFLDQTGSIRSIAVTSWDEGEGKTTVASQLALSLTASGDSTLIVDGDSRQASLQSLLLPNAPVPLEPGLSDCALGAASPDDAIYDTRVPSLGLMPTGRHVPSMSSLLDTQQGRAVLDRLREYGDLVVIDCPPLASGADAPTIAARVDGVILVVSLDKATTVGLRASLRRLEAVSAPILGIAVNRDREGASIARYGDRNGGVNGDRPRGGSLTGRVRRVISPR